MRVYIVVLISRYHGLLALRPELAHRSRYRTLHLPTRALLEPQ